MRDIIAITYDAVSGGPELTAAEWRQIQAGAYQKNASGLVYSGIRGGAVSNVGSAVTITPLDAVVQPSAALGAYWGAFPSGAAELSKTLAAAHATLVRVDAVDVKFFDHEADGSGLRGVDIQINAGTPGSGAPSFTGVGYRLGTFSVPASGGGSPVFTANTALVNFAMTGGVLQVKAAANRPASPGHGLEIFIRDSGVREIYIAGTGWRNLLGAPWIPWTTDWRAPGGSVAHGTGGGADKTALYRDLGDKVDFKIRIKRGTSGTSVGDGAYTWSLPPGMDATTFDSDAGTGYYYRAAAATDRVPLVWGTVNGQAIGAWRTWDAQRLAYNTVAWAAGDVIVLNGSYQKTQD